MAISKDNTRITITISKELEKWFDKIKKDEEKTSSELFSKLVLNWLQYKYCPLPEEVDALKDFLNKNGRTKDLDNINFRIASEQFKEFQKDDFRWSRNTIKYWDGYEVLLNKYKMVVYCKGTIIGDKIFYDERNEILRQLVVLANELKERYGYWSFKKFVKDSEKNYDYLSALYRFKIRTSGYSIMYDKYYNKQDEQPEILI